jgi:hypothetical protein
VRLFVVELDLPAALALLVGSTFVLLFACLVGLIVVELAFAFGLFTFLVACVLRAGSSVCLDLALLAVDLALLASCILGSMTVFLYAEFFLN